MKLSVSFSTWCLDGWLVGWMDEWLRAHISNVYVKDFTLKSNNLYRIYVCVFAVFACVELPYFIISMLSSSLSRHFFWLVRLWNHIYVHKHATNLFAVCFVSLRFFFEFHHEFSIFIIIKTMFVCKTLLLSWGWERKRRIVFVSNCEWARRIMHEIRMLLVICTNTICVVHVCVCGNYDAFYYLIWFRLVPKSGYCVCSPNRVHCNYANACIEWCLAHHCRYHCSKNECLGLETRMLCVIGQRMTNDKTSTSLTNAYATQFPLLQFLAFYSNCAVVVQSVQCTCDLLAAF